MNAVKMSKVEEKIYSMIGDAGAVTAKTLYRQVGVMFFPAEAWLRRETERGFLYEDGAGRYSVCCPIAA